MNARQIKFLPRLSIRPIRHNDEQALPNAREIDAYAANGHVVTRRIFSDAEIALAIKAADEIYAGRRDVRLWSDKSRSYLDWKPGSPDHIRINDFIALQSEKIRRLLENPLLGATAARLANTRTVRLFNSSLIYKPPYGIRKSGDERVGWHTDHAYWPTCTSTNMLTVWIPMQDANEANGGLRFINGSHRWEDREDLRLLRSEKNFICDDHHKLNSRLANLGFETSEVCPSVPAGHMSVHHCLTLHSSVVLHSVCCLNGC